MTETAVPARYYSDHLFLLMGKNPLPNYVAASLLVNRDGVVYLVHSGGEHGTGESANRLQALLCRKGIARRVIKIEVHESSAADIYRKIGQAVAQIKGGAIGLNYTGGTKVMAVHTYQALQKGVADIAGRSGDLVCTYLDARHYKLLFDPVGLSRPPGKPVLLAAPIGLVDLLTLHNITLKAGLPARQPVLLTAATQLAQTHTNRANRQAWRFWCDKVLAPLVKTASGKNYQGESKLKKVSVAWPDQPGLKPAVQSICQELGVAVSETIDLSAATAAGLFAKVKYFCQWLDGFWLEHYVLGRIIEVASQCDLYDYGMGLATVQSAHGYDFEFDVAALRGYQLFALSCYSGTHLTKLKLFEAYTRAGQLGGDEARAAIVSPVNNPHKLQQQIARDAPGKVRVFGAEHLVGLAGHLEEWFQNPV